MFLIIKMFYVEKKIEEIYVNLIQKGVNFCLNLGLDIWLVFDFLFVFFNFIGSVLSVYVSIVFFMLLFFCVG